MVAPDASAQDRRKQDSSGNFFGIDPNGPAAPAPIRTPVAVAMGDSFISGQGAGGYPRNGPNWNGSIEDPAFCDRSPLATIHVADLPNIDETYNVSCSGATVGDITLPASGRAGLDSQVNQLKAIASLPDKQVELIQFSIGGNNSSFYFGKILAACMAGFIFDGYTTGSLAGAFTDGQWYDWTYNYTEQRITECTASKMPAIPEGAQTASVTTLRWALIDLAEAIGHNYLQDTEGFGPPSWTPPSFDDSSDQIPYAALVDYIDAIDDAWFRSKASHVPMMTLPFPTDLTTTIDDWWETRGVGAAQLSTAYNLRGVRLLHEWQHKIARRPWGDTSWSLSGDYVIGELNPVGAAHGIASADRFPPAFRGEQISSAQLDLAMWIPKEGPSETFIREEAPAVANAVSAVITMMSGIFETDGTQRYPEGSYRIVMQDYVSPFAEDFAAPWLTANGKKDSNSIFKRLVKNRYAAGCPIHEATASWAADQTRYLSLMTDDAFATVRSTFESSDIARLKVSHALDGVRLCETADPAQWQISPVVLWSMGAGLGRQELTAITANWSWQLKGRDELHKQCLYWSLHACQDSGHPNAAGSFTLGRCLTAAWLLTADTIDCRRTGGTMRANGLPVTSTLHEPTIDVSMGAVTSENVLYENGTCSHATFSAPINASIVNPNAAPGWSSPTWTLSASMTGGDPAVQVAASSASMTISGTAPCIPFGVYEATVTITATGATGSATRQLIGFVPIRGSFDGEF